MYSARVIIYRDDEEIYNIVTFKRIMRDAVRADIKEIASDFESGDLGWEIGEEPEDDDELE